MASPEPEPSRIRFDAFELDATSGELRESGVLRKLQPQPFRVLLLLIEHAGQVVTREEIQRCLWRDSTFVDFEHGINFSINQIRGALADNAEHPRYIETLPRRGYRFIGAVKRDTDSKRSAAASLAAVGVSGFRADPRSGPVSGVTTVLTAALHRRWPLGVGGAFAVFLVAGSFFRHTERQFAPVSELNLRQLTNNSSENYIRNGSISPDGKYLAYTDRKGMQVKLIETGETHSIPQPETLKNSPMEWEIGPWFPDGTRFLANAHPAGLNPADWRYSIWTVSLVGGTLRRLRDDATASAISPDGSTVAFGTNRDQSGYGDHEIWLMGSDGENARKLYDTDENNTMRGFTWFPHGQRVLYIRNNKSGGDTLLTRELSGGPVTTILPPSAMKKVIDGDLVLLPDARLLYALWETNHNGHSENYWELRLDPRTGEPSGEPKRVTNWVGFGVGDTTVTADGKRLAFLEFRWQSNVYVADLENKGTHITTPSRLTFTESDNRLMAWTTDSKAVIFVSDRDGSWGIFRQSIDSDTAEPIRTGLENWSGGTVLVSPDGAWVLYSILERRDDPSTPIHIMRVPITGGPSQLLFTAVGLEGWDCSISPASLCVIAEKNPDGKQYVLTEFDPVQGRGRELKRVDTDPNGLYGWKLSPDGARIAVYSPKEERIHIMFLDGRAPLTVMAHKDIFDLRWAADGESMFASTDLFRLHVDFQGNSQVLWHQKDAEGIPIIPIPSPDGRRSAFWLSTQNGNLWMMEKF
jgi:Tol biopolymer transport system component/DNA-binding winged helix-turn-helix (wHTH) protein